MNAPMSMEQMQAMLAQMQEQNAKLTAALEAKSTEHRRHSLKVGKAGTVCLYHGARYPIAKYASEWAHILPFIKSGAIERFIEANRHLLADDKGSAAQDV